MKIIFNNLSNDILSNEESNTVKKTFRTLCMNI